MYRESVAGKSFGGLVSKETIYLLYDKPPKPPAMPCRWFLIRARSELIQLSLAHNPEKWATGFPKMR
jgi:hypothetical protein